jgi:hypothetical protein
LVRPKAYTPAHSDVSAGQAPGCCWYRRGPAGAPNPTFMYSLGAFCELFMPRAILLACMGASPSTIDFPSSRREARSLPDRQQGGHQRHGHDLARHRFDHRTARAHQTSALRDGK